MEIKEKHWSHNLAGTFMGMIFLAQFFSGFIYCGFVILLENEEFNCKLSDMKLSDIVFLINFIIGSYFMYKLYFEEK